MCLAPYALSKWYGGWAPRELVEPFVRYAKRYFTEFKEPVCLWITFNEINCLTAPFGNVMVGGHPVTLWQGVGTHGLGDVVDAWDAAMGIDATAQA